MSDRPVRCGWLSLALQLARDTFRQAMASGVCAMMAVVTLVCVALCLTLTVKGDRSLRAGAEEGEPSFFLPRVGLAASGPLSDAESARREGVELIDGRVTMAFGAVSFPISRERRDAVRLIELLLAGAVAGTVGLLMTLVWTAGFLPSFLDPAAAAVALAKPTGRVSLLLGKYAGVLCFVGIQGAAFLGLTWLAIGLRTGVWDTAYWWCLPLLLLQFAVFYSFSVLLAVCTRSAIACVFGSVLFWLVAWCVNYAGIMARSPAADQAVSRPARALAEAAYWVSPKPIDGAVSLFNALESRAHFDAPLIFRQLEASPAYTPLASALSLVAIAAVLLAVAAHEFRVLDY